MGVVLEMCPHLHLTSSRNMNADRGSWYGICTQVHERCSVLRRILLVVFEAAHRKQSSNIYWHIDNNYVGQTKSIHEMGLNIKEGKHVLTLVDELGNTITRNFTIVDKQH